MPSENHIPPDETVFSVFFDGQFWVGIIERCTGKCGYQAAKIVFGAKPSEEEIQDLLINRYPEFLFSPVQSNERRCRSSNPKKKLRDAKRAMQDTGYGTKAQNALKAMRDEKNSERRTASRTRKSEKEDADYLKRKEKQKARHRGK